MFNATTPLLNAESIPIEYIDRIQITLNPMLIPFINFKKCNLDYMRLSYVNYFGKWLRLDIQAQRINPFDIHRSIAEALYQVLFQGYNYYPMVKNMSKFMLYWNLKSFVYEVREIEFSFDFKPNAIKIINPDAFIHHKGTLYSPDRRRHTGRPSRKSFVSLYDRVSYLKHNNQLAHHKIDSNRYSNRLEFRLTKQNCPYRTVDSLIGTYHDVITRYISYLAVLYNRFLNGNMLIDPTDHPYFALILQEASKGRTRYTGSLEKRKIHETNKQIFMTPDKESAEKLVSKALKD